MREHPGRPIKLVAVAMPPRPVPPMTLRAAWAEAVLLLAAAFVKFDDVARIRLFAGATTLLLGALNVGQFCDE